ncbi:hypothetical protein VPH35_050588 [Triticum aestivum]
MKSSSQSHSPRTPSPRARGTAAAAADHARSSSEPWVLACVDDTCVNDVESFARTVAAVKSKPGPDLLPSVLFHYAAKWPPDVATSASGRFLPPESPTATWLKKRLLLETLVAALPPDPPNGAAADDGITCDFLLKLLRAGSMVGADAALLRELESRAARRLDQATLAAVMMPAFGHAPGGSTLLDVQLTADAFVYVNLAGWAAAPSAPPPPPPPGRPWCRWCAGSSRRAARAPAAGPGPGWRGLVDAYLAEAALEAGLRPAELEELAHARAADAALYRAVDTYLKVSICDDLQGLNDQNLIHDAHISFPDITYFAAKYYTNHDISSSVMVRITI